MFRLLTDENFNEKIVRGLYFRSPRLDLVSVRDVGLNGQSDPLILNWAAQNDRTLLTHDKQTMTKYAERLLIRAEPMAGVILVPNNLQIGRAINDLHILIECCLQSEMRGRIEYLPL
jgi:predicted nuclease of predicted toxin-antitoxin system